MIGDFDCDKQDEIFACLCVGNYKGTPISEYMSSFSNVNENHVLIKDRKVIPIDLEKLYGEPISKDAKYLIVESKNLQPKVNFLVVRTGFGDGGGCWFKEKYFYFDIEGKLKYFSSLSCSGYEMESSTDEAFEFKGNKVKHIHNYIEWKDCEPLPAEIEITNYSWDGKNFIEQ